MVEPQHPDRPRVRPSDVPDGGIPAVPAAPLSADAVRRRQTRGVLRRGLTSRRVRWSLAGAAAAAALIGGLLSEGYLSAAAPPVSGATSSNADSGTSADDAADGGTADSLGDGTRTGPDAGAPPSGQAPSSGTGRIAASGTVHKVVIEARSSGRVGTVGYLVPTGIGGGATHGSRRVRSSTFTLALTASGQGRLALVFVQAGASGVPVTCSVTVDGRTTAKQTTSGPFGRRVCRG